MSQLATQLALWPNSNGVPDCPPPTWTHTLLWAMPWQWARGNGNGRGGPTLATNVLRNDSKNSDGQGGPTPDLRKEVSYGMDTAAGAAADEAQRCHEQAVRGVVTRWVVEVQGNATTS